MEECNYILDAEVGQKVYYIPFTGCDPSLYENGIIKSIHPSGDSVFVIYHCGGEWDHYWDYTGALTSLQDLKSGWVETL